MDILREREEKDNLERQLREEQKLRVLTQKRLRREKRTRRQLQEELEMENKRRMLLEESLRTSGATEHINLINEKLSDSDQKPSSAVSPPAPPQTSTAASSSNPPQNDRDRLADRIKQERDDAMAGYGQQPRDARECQPPPPPPPPPPQQDNKPWGYSGMEMINSGAATFWQNYSDSLAQELEMERKSRRQQAEGEVKSPLQDRSSYYKNSVMFTSSAT